MSHPYASREYTCAVAGEGRIAYVEELDAWIILREVPGTEYVDAAGPYPFSPSACPNSKQRLNQSLRELDVVSMVVVTDALQSISTCFTDMFDEAHAYKTHQVIERGSGPIKLSRHHRREIRKAQQVCDTRVIALADYMGEWCALYKNLISRHRLRGTHCFSRSYFEALATMPEFVMIAAFVDNRLVSGHIWVAYDEYVYSHLAASSDEGYKYGASYAIHGHAISSFEPYQIIDLGGVADSGGSMSGLDYFKRGFANQTRTNWICGSIANQDAYECLCRKAGVSRGAVSYFPAYRAPAT